VTDVNKELMRRLYEEGITNGDWPLIRELCDEEMVSRMAPPGRPHGPEPEIEAI